MRWWTIGFVVSCLFFAGCGSPDDDGGLCGPATCTGCCDGDLCRPGEALSHCGVNGASCSACIAGESCNVGVCEPASTGCGPGNCASGCCLGDMCHAGSENGACGSSGLACNVCGTNQTCNASRVCEDPSAGCQQTCAGCCVGNTCLPGTATDACGQSGGACITCLAGQVCDGGACEGNCDSSTCSGCCDGNSCRAGTGDARCGSQGASCQACPPNTACDQGDCLLGEGQVCSMTIDCAGNAICASSPNGNSSTCRTTCVPGGASCLPGFSCVDFGGGQGACVPMPVAGSQWNVIVVGATVRPNDPATGTPWDAGGGAPDTIACLKVGGVDQGCTSQVSDSHQPVWNLRFASSFAYSSLSNAEVTFWDVDITTDDYVAGYLLDLRSPWADESWCWTWDVSGNTDSGLTQIEACAEAR